MTLNAWSKVSGTLSSHLTISIFLDEQQVIWVPSLVRGGKGLYFLIIHRCVLVIIIIKPIRLPSLIPFNGWVHLLCAILVNTHFEEQIWGLWLSDLLTVPSSV